MQKMTHKGKCIRCGEEAINKNHCKNHAEDARVRSRNRYRRKWGIALDRPLSNRGRPRSA